MENLAKEVNFNFANNDKPVVFLQGNYQHPKDPIPVDFKGDIKAPGDYMENKGFWPDLLLVNPAYCRLEVDIDNSELLFIANDRDNFRDKILGKLSISTEIGIFEINKSGAFLSAEDMANRLRKNQYYFVDKDICKKVVSDLTKFKMKIETTIESDKDKAGNKKQLLEKMVNSDMSRNFFLSLPIFKGFEPMTIPVELCIEAVGDSPKFYLESIELYEIMSSYKKTIFDAEIERFKKFGCAIIRK